MINYFFIFIFLHLTVGIPRINLYLTDWLSETNSIRHHCLRVAAVIDQWNINRQIISYCIAEPLLEHHLMNNISNDLSKFTFSALSQANITSEQLYQWSAPIDLIENYQFYLEQKSTSNDFTLGNRIFYNCTLPRFGSFCQYQFDYFHSNHGSLYEMIHDFYDSLTYEPLKFTCYMHVQCDRGPSPSCLDWSEICDGKIDCRNGGLDEEHCWQLEVNECDENEYRCANGQCIPKSFYLDDRVTPDCLDHTDEPRVRFFLDKNCHRDEPSLVCADVACTDMPLTSSCLPHRTNLLVRTLFSVENNDVLDDCWLAMKCALHIPTSDNSACNKHCKHQSNVLIINQSCPDMILFPSIPVLFNEVYFAHRKNDSNHRSCGRYWKPYYCFSTTRYDEFFSHKPKVILNNRTCWQLSDFYNPTDAIIVQWIYAYAIPSSLFFQKYTLLWNYSSNICNRSNMYQCINSPKCISIYRLMNNIDDCPYRDDEDIKKNNNTNAIEQMKRNSFYCLASKEYIPLTSVTDGKCDCDYARIGWCEDEELQMNYIRRNISFQTICDGYTELLPILIDGRNETDETECEQWLCNNIYTRCDSLWNCPNGEDEIDCFHPSSLTCSFNEHFCVSNQTLEPICLSLDKINDGQIDCIGATDEPRFCHQVKTIRQKNNFYCKTNKSIECLNMYNLCDMKDDCMSSDDERFCRRNRSIASSGSICQNSHSLNLTDVEQFLCNYAAEKSKGQIIHFTLDKMNNLLDNRSTDVVKPTHSSKSWILPSQMQNLLCHRGLDLRRWLDKHENLSNIACLCPPSYYGDRCQYQNQRITLSIGFRVPSDSHQIPFSILVSLTDDTDKHIIHSYEQFSYLSIRDCQVKFSFYLLYSSRPKDSNKQYFVQIDIYEKISLNYRGSLLKVIQFPFLPVYRLSFIVDIPSNNIDVQRCSMDECHHGKCLRYFHNSNNRTFCQCNQGWSGRYCTIPHSCQCSTDAVCLGVDANNRSICICPLHRFGPRCYLHRTSCTFNETCQNGGQCIPNDEISESTDNFTCICPRGYTGKRCEIIRNGIVFSFEKSIISTQSIFIHFIQLMNKDKHQRATTLRTIPFRQESILIHWFQSFHLIFVEFPIHNYYFALAQNTYNQSAAIKKTINASNRCRHIRELFNVTIVEFHLLRRIKYYQIPCQYYGYDLSCFYDEIHLCLCQNHRRQRVANCFEFDHNMTFNCLGRSICENDGQCFQDAPNCPRRSICICSPCYYGSRCQFTTTTFSLSLDAILGYQIQADLKLIKQPLIVQISVALAIVYILIGSINGILTLITFKSKVTCNVGCGYYLFATAITVLLITWIFGLKFFFLLLTQMQVINNRLFLSIQCYSIDFLLRCSLNTNQWLTACVAVERAITTMKGAKFNRKKSKKIAKKMIWILLIIIIGTCLDDPIHRRLIDEENEDEKRIWCVVSYSSSFQIFNSTMNIFHFLTPFLLNLISAILLITRKSRRKSLHNDQTYNRILREELRQYKHLLIGPVVLVILALPRVIFLFISKCMKSNNESWLFLTAYWVSIVPSVLTFILFILPSKFYKKELRMIITRYHRKITGRTNQTLDR